MPATKQVILFYHWTMEALAKQVVADYAGRVRLGRCSWDSFSPSARKGLLLGSAIDT